VPLLSLSLGEGPGLLAGRFQRRCCVMKYSELKKFILKLRGLGFMKIRGQNLWRITFRFTDNAVAYLNYTF